MLDIKLVREQSEVVKKGISAKGCNPDLVDRVLKLDEQKRKLMFSAENLRAQRNQLTKDQVAEGKKIKEELKQAEPQLAQLDSQLSQLLNQIPNLPLADVPVGKSEKDNVEIRRWGDPKKFDFPVKDHLQLGQDLGILDFTSGAKVSGSQFYYWFGDGALLELALIQFAFNLLAKEGFIPVITPDLAKSRYYLGTGYAPKGDEAQTYTIEGQDLGLIATAEVTLAGLHADEILLEKSLPLKYIGYSHVFRREAGAYGKYSKGIYRVHQFTKAEMFIYCRPKSQLKCTN